MCPWSIKASCCWLVIGLQFVLAGLMASLPQLESVMKIGNSDSPQPLATTTLVTSQPATPEPKAAGTSAAPPDASAQVALSSTATALLQGTPGATATNADFDAEKVARVASAISEGTFKPNPEVIADKLIANAQELLNKASS